MNIDMESNNILITFVLSNEVFECIPTVVTTIDYCTVIETEINS